MSFSQAFDETADEIQGNDLLKDQILRDLEGVPFGITRLTFRRGAASRKTKGMHLAYVSVEGVIADKEYLASRKRSLDDTPFRPGDHIIFNDGSSGVYRQLVQYLEGKGYIVLPDSLPKDGPKEECRYDLPPSKWIEINAGTNYFDMDADFMVYAVDVRLMCPRGLRNSDYTNEYAPDGATTHYLA
jgi:hypothetical protein